MSEENVELVLRVQPASDADVVQLLRDDLMWAALSEATAPFIHPEAEFIRVGLPDARTYTGIDGFRAGYLDWLAPWVSYRVETDEVIDCGNRVLVLNHGFGCLKGSTQEVKGNTAAIYTVRDGKLARCEIYDDRAEALKAVGLED